MKREAIVGLGKGQLYFPFMLDDMLSSYILNELPTLEEKCATYNALMKDNLELNEFIADHYCNPASDFYFAETYHDLNNPQNLPDGYILNWSEYNRLTR